ncbi:hypothetical protein ONZ45_g2083 [Pleurotus djamor]|nr:hypothetical protein ONZ45_g2083 [Pleurotus djamor]
MSDLHDTPRPSTRQPEYGADAYDLNEDGHLDVHLASIAEKKKLWWKNAIINSAFIASWKKAVPAAMATGLDIGLSNLSLKTITLSFYTMCKSSSLIFVLLFAFLFRLEKFSFRLIGVIFLIFCGVLLMVATETHFVLTGFILVTSASALGGFRWALTQLLLKDKKMGMDNPAATVYWLAPVMGLTLAVISAILDNWVKVFSSEFFSSFSRVLSTTVYLTSPGAVAFCMVMSEFYILQRVGIVPMSIAGIAKEVTTITLSTWFFGDELTPLNITGVGITVCGIGLFTYHKYRKSIESTVPLDAHGNPVAPEDMEDAGYTTALRETETLTSQGSEDFEEIASDNARLLFSEDEGEGDAEELRSIRSSKVKQFSGRTGAKRASNDEENTPLVSREDDRVGS